MTGVWWGVKWQEFAPLRSLLDVLLVVSQVIVRQLECF